MTYLELVELQIATLDFEIWKTLKKQNFHFLFLKIIL